MIDDDLLGDEHDAAGGLEPLHVECAVVAAEFHEVYARQVAGRIVEEHVLGAGVRGVDPAGIGAGMPAIDGGIVLEARVSATPGRLGRFLEHLAGRIFGARLAGPGFWFFWDALQTRFNAKNLSFPVGSAAILFFFLWLGG